MKQPKIGQKEKWKDNGEYRGEKEYDMAGENRDFMIGNVA